MLRSQNRLELLTISREAIVLPAVMQYNTPSRAMVSDNTTLILILIFLSQLILKFKSMLLIKLTGKVQEKKYLGQDHSGNLQTMLQLKQKTKPCS